MAEKDEKPKLMNNRKADLASLDNVYQKIIDCFSGRSRDSAVAGKTDSRTRQLIHSSTASC